CGDPGRSRRKTPACTGPISVRDRRAAQSDAEVVTAALARAKATEGFLSAASPGVSSLFFRDDHYRSHEQYLMAIAEAMRHEYETVARAGLIVQIDCPDLAMGRHIQYARLGLEEFRKAARLHIEALNHATASIPPEQLRMHVCWGHYGGPHHYDVPLADIIDIVLPARRAGHRLGLGGLGREGGGGSGRRVGEDQGPRGGRRAGPGGGLARRPGVRRRTANSSPRPRQTRKGAAKPAGGGEP